MAKKKVITKTSKKKIIRKKAVLEKKIKISKTNKKSVSSSNSLDLIFKENENQLISLIVKEFDKDIAPEPVEKGVSNFFSNLKEPIRSVSFIFQGEFYRSFNSLGRFTINTITSLGTIDVASRIGMEKNETDFGITLAKGGVSSGPYIVVPILGPSNLRDFSGDVVEYFVDPISNNVPNREYIAIGNGLNERVEVDDQLDKVRDASSDRYEMIKSIYYQNRNAQLEEEYIQNLPVPKIYIE